MTQVWLFENDRCIRQIVLNFLGRIVSYSENAEQVVIAGYKLLCPMFASYQGCFFGEFLAEFMGSVPAETREVSLLAHCAGNYVNLSGRGVKAIHHCRAGIHEDDVLCSRPRFTRQH